MKKAKKIILYIENCKGILGLSCKDCDETIKLPLEDIPSCGIKCACGQSYFFSEKDIKEIRTSLEELKLMRQSHEKHL